jgi:dTDP-4-amino-4,6-dideoxygalactose transaminase
MQKLLDECISSRRGVMTAHTEKAYALNKRTLPKSELFSHSSIMIPLYIGLTEREQQLVIQKIVRHIQP